ncbi:hypothetical protein ANO11243_081070 [Dothideomycetidae sp. 11243]|nr:hypothetical protein ANO11243_081070 [fungal sp. No.11243]
MADPPLDATCSICFSNPPKYRCPRCLSIRTCSLPCYKRHQQRATCTGTRDATTYVKKAQLSTAAGLDHDYNFLAGIERACRTAPTPDGDRPAKRRKTATAAFDQYLSDNRIVLRRAPPGIHRSTTNKSRFLPKSKKIAWTVEWIDEHDARRETEVLADTPLSTAYALVRTNKSSASGADPAAKRHLYLHRPRALRKQVVLIPLDTAADLTTSLSRQTIDEYPTIYHLPYPPDGLPDGFCTSAAYDKSHKAELARLDRDDIVKSVATQLGGEKLGEAWGKEKDEKDWDAERVLDMLRRDVALRR